MTILAAIHHKTHYQFDRAVVLSPHEIRLRPAAHSRTPISAYSLRIEPAQHFIHWQQDAYGNFVARVSFPEPTRSLSITVDLVADLTIINPFDFFMEPWAEYFPFSYPDTLKIELAPFLLTEPKGERFKLWLAKFRHELPATINTTDFLVCINQAVQHSVAYLIRMEPGVQSPETTLISGSGSCRDSAWFLVQALRHLGIAARFVSGYLIQLTPDETADAATSANEFTDLHAWCEAYIPGAGWVGLDATSGLLAGEGHIPLAATASPGSAAPVSGLTSPCESSFDVVMTVSRLHEDPRVTKPYTDSQWQTILALGQQIDTELCRHDVRLTQGGEPTFVAIDNMESAEWNTEALGVQKWELANILMKKLQQRFSVGGVLHFGQGKWYPGEPLPRWALTTFWRTDGLPVWQDSSLLAEQAQAITETELISFAVQLCQHLNLDAEYLIPAFEDPWVVLDTESQLPVNIDPHGIALDNPDERSRLARLLRNRVDAIAGFVLPIKPVESEPSTWQSSFWPLRQPRLYLIPGDSALGYRLPLNSLPWVTPEQREITPAVDPFAARSSLSGNTSKSIKPNLTSPILTNPEAKEVIHTALALQIRDGFLYVFLPPIATLEAYLSLLSAIEQTALSCKLAIRLEGYQPPRDPRLQSLSVTPDPGVIEVNIHPSASWDNLVAHTEALYADARLSGLSTEKFMLDGRHTGTGGGNHITLGGASAADSPFLRRPDLLQSLITYWQHHPGLSYLFSGQFLGPTSQAPRVDEARDDNLYELEIAFQQMNTWMPPGMESQQPWLVDRLLRNLLVDLTGNTHRSEFCIDKLYSPDSATGRLGIIELRAFEMPPHYRMSLVQALLLRALIARFWKTPYQGKLVYWDTSLHDKFMLPHFIAHDINEVCAELRQAGYNFDPAWFAPFLEFRFPRYGTLNAANIQLELRQAIEPWHVLGEEMAGGGTARYVDSSVERMQVKVSGMTESRYQVTCNGRPLPIHPTGVAGEFVAAVRYKAWAPHSALHPSIGTQVPLVFDLVDTWNQRAIAGCTYHISHPGGRNYDTFPVNANSAEARRRSRFWDYGHTPGTVSIAAESINPRFPMTLDLRWHAMPRN